MARIHNAALALPLWLVLTTMPSTAQHYRWDLSANAGWSTTSGAMKGDNLRFSGDVLDELDGTSLGFDNNWISGAQLGYWFNRSIGLRANLSYMGTPFHQGDVTLFEDVNIWGGTGDVLFRLAKPRKNWSGSEWLPFIALGIGANWVNPAGDLYYTVNELDLDDDDDLTNLELEGKSGVPIVCRFALCAGPSTAGFPGVGGIPDVNNRTFFLRESTNFTGLIGLGTDLRLSPTFALRLETGGRFWSAPIDEVVQREGFQGLMIPFDEGVGSTVTQFYATLGLNYLMGLRPAPLPVAVLPAPPPPPPPPPPPRPRPLPPATEKISVCLVDPSLQGVQQVDATYYPATGDTTIMRNGVETKLADAAAQVMVATTTDWYVRGAPFEIGTAPKRLTYLSVGSARMIDASALRFVGTVKGLPVFSDRDEPVSILNGLAPNSDLDRVITENDDAYKALDGIRVLYVPLQATGCVFQALEKQLEVRKIK